MCHRVVFYTYVEAVAHQGAITDYPDGTFHPNQEISRVQVAVITQCSRHYAPYDPPSATFADVPQGGFGYGAIETLVHEGWLIAGAACNGGSSLCLRPNDNIRRDELSKVYHLAVLNLP